MSDKNEEEKRLNEYKKNVSKIMLKVYTDQQKIIDKLTIELIELKLILSQKNESFKIDKSKKKTKIINFVFLLTHFI